MNPPRRAPPEADRRADPLDLSDVLEHIQQEWDFMTNERCIPVQVALHLMDSSSLGRAHQYDQFQATHKQLQKALKAIVNGEFHRLQPHRPFHHQLGGLRDRAMLFAMARYPSNWKGTHFDKISNMMTSEHHQGFSSSIGTFHQVQNSIQESQQRVQNLKETLVQAKSSLVTVKPELKSLASSSRRYDDMLDTLALVYASHSVYTCHR